MRLCSYFNSLLNVYHASGECCDRLFNLIETFLTVTLLCLQSFRAHRYRQALHHAVQFSLGTLELLKCPNSVSFLHLLHSRWELFFCPELSTLLFQVFRLFVVFLEVGWYFAKVFVTWGTSTILLLIFTVLDVTGIGNDLGVSWSSC